MAFMTHGKRLIQPLCGILLVKYEQYVILILFGYPYWFKAFPMYTWKCAVCFSECIFILG